MSQLEADILGYSLEYLREHPRYLDYEVGDFVDIGAYNKLREESLPRIK